MTIDKGQRKSGFKSTLAQLEGYMKVPYTKMRTYFL